MGNGDYKRAKPLKEIYLYYLGVRLFTALLVLALLFIKPNTYHSKDLILLLISLYTALSIFFFLKGGDNVPPPLQRFIDYSFVLILVLVAANIVGILPTTIILASYAILYWKEYALLLLMLAIFLFISTFVRNTYPLEDFIVTIVYLLGLSLASSKLNLIAILSYKLNRLKEIKLETRKVQKTCATLSADLQIYREAEDIVTKLSSMKRFDNIEGVLANLLNAKSLKISAEGGKKIPFGEALAFQVGQLSVWLEPKHKFLLRDRYYKKKVETVLKMAKPYLESFLAKSK